MQAVLRHSFASRQHHAANALADARAGRDKQRMELLPDDQKEDR